MFESFKSPVAEPEKGGDVPLNYAEIARNRKEIEERKRKEQLEQGLKKLGKEIEIQAGVEKARETLEKDFEHKS